MLIPSETTSEKREEFLNGLTELSKATGIYVPDGTDIQFHDGVDVDKVRWKFEHGYEFVKEVSEPAEATEREYAGLREVFYIQIIGTKGENLVHTRIGDSFPTAEEVTRSLVAATGVYGHGVQAKIDKRTELNYV